MRYVGWLLLAMLLAGGWLPPNVAPVGGARAAPPPPGQASAHNSAAGVVLSWAAPPHLAGLPPEHLLAQLDLPLVAFGGVQAPAHLVAVRFTGSQPAARALHDAPTTAQPWAGRLPAAALPAPHLSQEPAPHLPRPRSAVAALSPADLSALPAAPISVLREARMRGHHIAVLAISPIFQQQGRLHLAISARATLPGAVLLQDQAARFVSSGPFLAQADPLPNPLAAHPGWKIQVSAAGIQRISGAALADAGGELATGSPDRLRLWHAGVELPLEVLATQPRLHASDELRFYAPPPGDRWNATATYWLTLDPADTPGSSAPRRMRTHPPASETAPLRTTARTQGTWRNNTLYDAWFAGPDGDHWFAAELSSALPPATYSITLPTRLPLAPGTLSLTLSGVAAAPGPHRLEVALATGAVLSPTIHPLHWQGVGDWTHTITATVVVSPDGSPAQGIGVQLRPHTPAALLLDGVAWEQPAHLDAAGRGLVVQTAPGTWRYQVQRPPAAAALYEISLPTNPVRVRLPDAAGGEWQAGPQPRTYLLAGPDTLHSPPIAPYTPPALLSAAHPPGADVLYIAPAAWHPTLQPLLRQRSRQGYRALAVDAQQIYDGWSYGQVAPAAIREFLRTAAAAWDPAPLAVVLVGDGTYDPHNYSGRDNPNHLPPFLHWFDPWLGETACDTCYVRLDGSDPLADALPDMAIGRLPAKNQTELAHLVAKLLRYETAPSGGAWRRRAVFLADNFHKSDGSTDAAGNFALLADAQAALLPADVSVERLYYDPTAPLVPLPWQEPVAARAYQRTLELFDTGAGLLTFIGHGYYWNWATTEVSADPPHLLGLYDPDRMRNARRLPVVLAMTCLTSAFHIPAYSGTTIDERLLLHPSGGAVAVWGSTGLGVVYGHDRLQQGFHQALWHAAPTAAPLGMLTQAGYGTLFTEGVCCQESLFSFVLLGDPLTQVRIDATAAGYLPLIRVP